MRGTDTHYFRTCEKKCSQRALVKQFVVTCTFVLIFVFICGTWDCGMPIQTSRIGKLFIYRVTVPTVPKESAATLETITTNTENSVTRARITLKPNVKEMINASSPKYAVTRNASYLIENPTLCSSVRNLTVLIIVHTAPKHFEHRLVIRRTWANSTYYRTLGTVRILFLLGLVKDGNTQKQITAEFEEHGDILQGYFLDTYHNLTNKGVMAYKWITEKCRNAKIILKVDDDVVVDMYSFLAQYAPKYISRGRQVLCHRLDHQAVLRNRRSKWFVKEDHFRNYSHYPSFCQGFMVMMTNDIIPDLYKSSAITPFFWIDDVFLYGIVPGNVPNITYNHLKFGTQVKRGSSKVADCYTSNGKNCDFLVVLGDQKHSDKIWCYTSQRHNFNTSYPCSNVTQV